MPALLEDPETPVAYRQSGQAPYPTADNPQIPSSIFPRPVTLRDRVTIATLIPFFSPDAVPQRLLAYLAEQLNKEIEGGDTYPMMNPLPIETFGPYWFGNFGAIMVLGDIGGIEAVTDMDREGADWNKLCLGSFYVKPNYPGRSSHVCNGGFLVTPAARNKGVGKSMGQCYLDWAPQLGYTYSVFNLVYESNTASTRIWDSLGFKRIGRVPGCGNLKSSEEPIDAIIYGRDLKSEGENDLSEERFDKIRYYLRHQLYPQGADRSEKSRLRSAATHYKLVGGDDGGPEKLFLKDKEVISDPQTQYEIAKQVHLQAHGGINKTTAIIATQYHWIRIKETVSHVIKNCPACKDVNKPPMMRSEGRTRSKTIDEAPADLPPAQTTQPNAPEVPPVPQENLTTNHISNHSGYAPLQTAMDLSNEHLPGDHLPADHLTSDHLSSEHLPGDHLSSDHLPGDHLPNDHMAGDHLAGDHLAGDHMTGDHLTSEHLPDPDAHLQTYDEMAIDPQIMEQLQAHLVSEYGQSAHGVFQGGMPTFADASHLQTHHDPRDFNHQTSDHQFIHDPNPPMLPHDHVMDEGGAGTGLSNMQPMQHVLPMEFIDPGNNQQYKLEQ